MLYNTLIFIFSLQSPESLYEKYPIQMDEFAATLEGHFNKPVETLLYEDFRTKMVQEKDKYLKLKPAQQRELIMDQYKKHLGDLIRAKNYLVLMKTIGFFVLFFLVWVICVGEMKSGGVFSKIVSHWRGQKSLGDNYSTHLAQALGVVIGGAFTYLSIMIPVMWIYNYFGINQNMRVSLNYWGAEGCLVNPLFEIEVDYFAHSLLGIDPDISKEVEKKLALAAQSIADTNIDILNTEVQEILKIATPIQYKAIKVSGKKDRKIQELLSIYNEETAQQYLQIVDLIKSQLALNASASHRSDIKPIWIVVKGKPGTGKTDTLKRLVQIIIDNEPMGLPLSDDIYDTSAGWGPLSIGMIAQKEKPNAKSILLIDDVDYSASDNASYLSLMEGERFYTSDYLKGKVERPSIILSTMTKGFSPAENSALESRITLQINLNEQIYNKEAFIEEAVHVAHNMRASMGEKITAEEKIKIKKLGEQAYSENLSLRALHQQIKKTI